MVRKSGKNEMHNIVVVKNVMHNLKGLHLEDTAYFFKVLNNGQCNIVKLAILQQSYDDSYSS